MMPAPSKFSQALASDAFLVTVELDPPKGADLSVVQEKISALKEKAQAVVVSDNHSARMRMAPLGLCRALLDQGLEPILTMTCRDRNRLALQSDLLAAFSLGMQNVLAVTGDHTSWGDHPQAKPVYDLDSVQLLRAVSALNQGQDFSGNPLEGATPHCTVGAVVPLSANPLPPVVMKFRKKAAQGVDFFLSHPLFDLETVEDFFKQTAEIKLPLLATVCLLSWDQIARYGPGSLPGLFIPEGVLEQFKSWEKEAYESKALEFTGKLIEAVKNDGRFRGVHLMLQDRGDKIGDLI
jgi:methylenetetrahydrofolate reductase (NADPH)